MAESVFARKQRESVARCRSQWAFVQGLPALAVAIICLVCLMLARSQRQAGDVRLRYLEAAQKALGNEDWPAVEMLGGKLVELRPDDPVGTYYLARCAQADADLDRARRLMKQIAPADQPGFAPAQWWLVRDLVAGRKRLSREQAREMRGHLQQFLRTHDQHAEARMLLGQAELALGNLDGALVEMKQAADADPGYRLTVARVAGRFGRNALARSQAEQACRWLEQRVYQSPHDVDQRLLWVDALATIGEFAAAGDALIAGLDQQDDPRLRARLVQLSVTSFDVLGSRRIRTSRDFQHQLALVDRGLSLAPHDHELLRRLAMLTLDPLDQDGRAGRLLQPYVDSGTAPAVVHLVFGNEALKRGELALARQHLEAAHHQQPTSPACLNNLAWVLAHEEQPDLHRALTLIDQALNSAPERAEFRETRGQILARMNRFEEAIPELRRGLASPGSFTQTHAVLADAYDAVGQTQLAAYYREQK